MIESLRNRWVKDIRRLRRRKGDRAVLEGPHLVREAAAAGIVLEYVLATPAVLAEREGWLDDLGAPLHTVHPEILEKVTDSDAPRGLLAVAALPRSGLESLDLVEDGVWIYAAGIQDPGNLGALARVAEAAGASALVTAPESVHPNHPRALRGSAGSLLRLPVAHGVPMEALSAHLEPVSPRWVALVANGEVELGTAPLDPPLALVVGAERGLDPRAEARCDLRLRIPMEPPVESLNTAVAAALALYAIRSGSRPSG